jgi:glycosyltransferase 2 family protein
MGAKPAAGPDLATLTPAPPAPPAGAGRRAWLLRGGGLLLLALLIGFLVRQGQLRPAQILDTLAHANPAWVALSVLLYFPFALIKSERWRLLAGDLGIGMGAGEAWRLYAVGLGAGALTPGQAGDVIKAWALQRRGRPLGAAIASTVLDRLFDVAGLAPLALLGVVVFGQEYVGGVGVVALISAAALGAVVLFAQRAAILRLVNRRIARAAAARGAADAPAGASSLGARSLLLAGGWTILSFAMSTFRVWLLALAIGLALDPAQVGGMVGLTTVAALVPVSVSGVGTRDAMLVALVGRLVAPPAAASAAAIALSTLILGLNLVNALAGYAVWWAESRAGRTA